MATDAQLSTTPAPPHGQGRKEQLVSCRLVLSQRQLLRRLNEKYGEGNYEIEVRFPAKHSTVILQTAEDKS